MAHTCDPWVSMARLAAESGRSWTFVGRPESSGEQEAVSDEVGSEVSHVKLSDLKGQVLV